MLFVLHCCLFVCIWMKINRTSNYDYVRERLNQSLFVQRFVIASTNQENACFSFADSTFNRNNELLIHIIFMNRFIFVAKILFISLELLLLLLLLLIILCCLLWNLFFFYLFVMFTSLNSTDHENRATKPNGKTFIRNKQIEILF